ncbi:hypothetical protein [Luteimonas vadosa]|uniref:Glycosyltransferase family 4 protein n=1 Tax=Luteimonas vadosa TaxID=1165507 RepID=A0ABP9DS17_9GAMM
MEHYGRTLSPCASIRLHGFLQYLRDSGHLEFRSLLVEELFAFAPDVIIWHRISIPAARDVDAMVAIARLVGARLIYDLDDNLLDMDDHGEGEKYRTMRCAVARSLEVADEVWCSTPALSDRVRPLVSGTRQVAANSLDPSIWSASKRGSTRLGDPDRLRLVYMGTRTHDEDFRFLCSVMQILDTRNPGVFSLSVIGVCERPPEDAPWLDVLEPPLFLGASYPGFAHWLQQQGDFDLGVAPLLSNRFNDCKSSIKVLDYAAIGLPTLASRVLPYTHSLRTGVDCFHAENTARAWVDELLKLASDRPAMNRVAGTAGQLVTPECFATGAQFRLERIQNVASVP